MTGRPAPRSISCAWCVVALTLVATTHTPAQAIRDAPSPSHAPVIFQGRVIDDATSAPVKRAIVTMTGISPAFSRIASTDEEGRFVFADLPPADVTVTAEKITYLTTYVGAPRPGRGPAVPFAIGAQDAALRTIRLTRGAVVAGTVFKENGRPASAVQLTVLEWRTVDGDRRLIAPRTGPTALTDDNGEYRIWGLAPGDYVVEATRLSSNPGPPSDAAHPAEYAPAYYPGVTDAALAQTISIAAGEERSAVNMTLQPTPVAAIHVSVLGMDGRPVAGAPVVADLDVQTQRRVTTDLQGDADVTSLPPGRVTLSARGPADRSASPPAWAAREVEINGDDQNVTLTLGPGTAVEGHIAFDGVSPLPDPARVSIVVIPAGAVHGAAAAVETRAAADGTFTLSGVVPGRYHLHAAIVGNARWWLSAARVDASDVLDGTLDVAAGRNPNVEIVFSDRQTTLAGRLVDSAGNPVPSLDLVVFPADERLRTTAPRRLRHQRLDAGGRFDIAGLPAGDYLLAAVTAMDDDDLSDPAWLESVAASAVRVALADGEHKTQDLRVGRDLSDRDPRGRAGLP